MLKLDNFHDKYVVVILNSDIRFHGKVKIIDNNYHRSYFILNDAYEIINGNNFDCFDRQEYRISKDSVSVVYPKEKLTNEEMMRKK